MEERVIRAILAAQEGYKTGRSVLAELLDRFPATMLLAASSILFALLLSVPGLTAQHQPGRISGGQIHNEKDNQNNAQNNGRRPSGWG